MDRNVHRKRDTWAVKRAHINTVPETERSRPLGVLLHVSYPRFTSAALTERNFGFKQCSVFAYATHCGANTNSGTAVYETAQ